MEIAWFILAAAGALAAVISLAWVAADARRRGRSGLFVGLLCLLTWPLGHLFWIMLRPPPALKG